MCLRKCGRRYTPILGTVPLSAFGRKFVLIEGGQIRSLWVLKRPVSCRGSWVPSHARLDPPAPFCGPRMLSAHFGEHEAALQRSRGKEDSLCCFMKLTGWRRDQMQQYYSSPEKMYLQYLGWPRPPTLDVSGVDQGLLRVSYEFHGTGARAFHYELLRPGVSCSSFRLFMS